MSIRKSEWGLLKHVLLMTTTSMMSFLPTNVLSSYTTYNKIVVYRLKDSVAPLIPMPKHPYKVHVWTGISRRGTTSILIFDGIMKSFFLYWLYQHASTFDGNVLWDKYLNTNVVWKLKDISNIYCQFVSYFIVEWLTFPVIFSWIVSQQVMVSETASHVLVDISTKIKSVPIER